MTGTWTLLCPTDCAPLQGKCYYTGGHGKPFVLVCETGLKSISYAEASKALKTHSVPERGTGLKTGRAGERRKGKPRSLHERIERHRKTSSHKNLLHP